MNRITLAFSKFENPSDEDLELADRLKEQSDAAWAKMKEFQSNPDNRPGLGRSGKASCTAHDPDPPRSRFRIAGTGFYEGSLSNLRYSRHTFRATG